MKMLVNSKLINIVIKIHKQKAYNESPHYNYFEQFCLYLVWHLLSLSTHFIDQGLNCDLIINYVRNKSIKSLLKTSGNVAMGPYVIAAYCAVGYLYECLYGWLL